MIRKTEMSLCFSDFVVRIKEGRFLPSKKLLPEYLIPKIDVF